MNNMPEWLWPADDEQAVREAELLIAETQRTLQRLEFRMQKQHTMGTDKSVSTDRVKSEVDSKISSLEKELRSVSMAAGPTKPMASHKRSSLPHPDRRHPPKNQIPKSNAESVVKTLHDKVQGALSVARDVSASLDLRTPRQSVQLNIPGKQDKKQNSLQNKGSCKSDAPANVKIFEVKSKSVDQGEKPLNVHRLQQSLLPVISIKRPLECQNIPPVQVPPTNKRLPGHKAKNVAVHHFQYQQSITASQVSQCQESKISRSVCEEPCTQSNQQRNGQQLESVLANLSAQLSHIEDLRELNQAQVNHVLRFLLSRVCGPSVPQPSERKSATSVNTNKKKNVSLQVSGRSSSSTASSHDSDSGKPRIAYDSLSRFLETYRQAAQQSMRASEKAAIRRKNIARKQQEEIKQCKQSAKNHLLIGPLRRAVVDSEAHLSESKNDQPSNASSTDCESNVEQINNYNTNRSSKVGGMLADSSHTSLLSSITDMLASKGGDRSIVSSEPGSNDNSAVHVQGASVIIDKEHSNGNTDEHSSLKNSPELEGVAVGRNSEDSYEDDWEEEDAKDSPKEDIQDAQVASSLRTIMEAEESHTSSQSEQTRVGFAASSYEQLVHKFNIQNPGDEQSQIVDSEQMNIKPNSTFIVDEHFDLEKQQPAEQDFFGGSISKSKETISQTEIPIQEYTQSNAEEVKNLQVCKETSEPKRCHVLSSGTESLKLHSTTTQTQGDWNLHLNDDLHLRSSVLLNWSLEDDWRRRLLKERGQRVALEDSEIHCSAMANVDEQWKKILSDLEKRIQTIEDQERVKHAVQEQRLRTIEEQERIRHLVEQEQIKCSLNEHKNLLIAKQEEARAQREKIKQDKANQVLHELEQLSNATQNLQQLALKVKEQASVSKVRDQEVQTNVEGTSSNPRQAIGRILSNEWLTAGDQKWLHLPTYRSDLTDKLLSYGQMGAIKKLESSQESSVSCSTASSVRSLHSLQLQVSLSDGELRGSGTGSCSCSEGEVCSCRRLRKFGERAPPDGSQAFSVGEQVINDISLGELALYAEEEGLKDVSHGEIAPSENQIGEAEATLNDIELADLSSGSAEIEWDSEHKLKPR